MSTCEVMSTCEAMSELSFSGRQSVRHGREDVRRHQDNQKQKAVSESGPDRSAAVGDDEQSRWRREKLYRSVLKKLITSSMCLGIFSCINSAKKSMNYVHFPMLKFILSIINNSLDD